jgi:hypothetical protein
MSADQRMRQPPAPPPVLALPREFSFPPFLGASIFLDILKVFLFFLQIFSSQER